MHFSGSQQIEKCSARSLSLHLWYGCKKISSKWKFAAFSAEHDEKRLFSNFILQVMIDRNIFQKLTRNFGQIDPKQLQIKTSFSPHPDDHTRVRLRSKGCSKDDEADANGGNHSEDYLNANFVDGFRQPRAYIATQGPIQGTFSAFWKMVWEQNTQVIVMITHLFENGKVRKCDQNFSEEKNHHFYYHFSPNAICTGRTRELKLMGTCQSAFCVKTFWPRTL